jgi:1,4-dihydroxy-2-naphthoyl-CoA hydrolase
VPHVSKAIPLHEAFDGTLGLTFDPTAPDDVRASVEVRDGLCNPFGIVHGGVYSSIAESIAAASTIYRVHRDGGSAIGSTNHTSLLRPISEGAIHARGRVLHTGRTSWTWDVEFRDDEGRLCASCRVTIAIRRYTAAPDR